MNDPAAFVATLRSAWSRPTLDEALAEARRAFTPDVVLRQPLTRPKRGFDSFERHVRGLALIFRDLRIRVVRWETAGDAVSVTFELTGTVGRQRLRMLSRDRFVLAGAVARERRASLNAWSLVRPVLATPSAWPRALGAYLRML